MIADHFSRRVLLFINSGELFTSCLAPAAVRKQIKPSEKEGELDRNTSLLQGHQDEPFREQNVGWSRFFWVLRWKVGDVGPLGQSQPGGWCLKRQLWCRGLILDVLCYSRLFKHRSGVV